MKLKLIIILVMFSSISCRHDTSIKENETPAEKIRKEAVSIAEDYALNQLKNGSIATDANGFITIKDSLRSYIFDPSRIVTGFIDSDSLDDAIVTVTSFSGQDIDLVEHLILLNTNGNLMLIRSFEADMKILRLSDRIITVEVHTKPRTSPLYNCAACKAIINYKYKEGDLVKIEEPSTSSQD
jgi:hypothetical protein